MKRIIADLLIRILRCFKSYDWKYDVIRWGYGKQSWHAWEAP